ncbi:DNA repair and recombination protein RadB [Candidatus Woesearchaeota archaeon]|nr:DNA repair and recombination protein RadB [Candidatus Woesearchaeota archaeon]
MEAGKTSSGTKIIDDLLGGGFDRDVITVVYGPSSAGKTNLCLIAMADVVRRGKKAVFIDTEGVSIDRVKQIAPDYQKLLENVLFLKPTNFEEQRNVFERLAKLVSEKIGMIIVDSVSMLYRLEIAKSNDTFNVNRTLGYHLNFLSEIARKKNIPILVTNQVYSDVDGKDQVKLVGGDILKYSSKCLIELQKLKHGRKAILRKHRSLPEKETYFEIYDKGIRPLDNISQ